MENLKVPLVSVAKSCVHLVLQLLKQPGCSSVPPDVTTATDITRFRRMYCFKVKKINKYCLKKYSRKRAVQLLSGCTDEYFSNWSVFVWSVVCVLWL